MSMTAQIKSAAKANGLLHQFCVGVTLLGMKVSQWILGPVEELNWSLQSPSVTTTGMCKASTQIKDQLLQLRTDKQFKLLLETVLNLCIQYKLDPVTIPWQRRPPSRFIGSGEPHVSHTAENHFQAFFPGSLHCPDPTQHQTWQEGNWHAAISVPWTNPFNWRKSLAVRLVWHVQRSSNMQLTANSIGNV